jgi:hypothetical protein
MTAAINKKTAFFTFIPRQWPKLTYSAFLWARTVNDLVFRMNFFTTKETLPLRCGKALVSSQLKPHDPTCFQEKL